MDNTEKLATVDIQDTRRRKKKQQQKTKQKTTHDTEN
jgi:hypothetical protein